MAQAAMQAAAMRAARREAMSGILLNGILSSLEWEPGFSEVATLDETAAAEIVKHAVRFADALMAELDKPRPLPPELQAQLDKMRENQPPAAS
jgi:hypothetical protein